MSDFVTVLSEKLVTAAKQHKCMECRRTINVGEKYLYETYVGPDRGDPFRAHKTCRHCIPMRDLAMSIDFDGMFWYGGIFEQLCDSGLGSDRDQWKIHLAISGMGRGWRRKNGKMWRVLT